VICGGAQEATIRESRRTSELDTRARLGAAPAGASVAEARLGSGSHHREIEERDLIEIFEWRTAKSARLARQHSDVAKVWEAMGKVCDLPLLDSLEETKGQFPHFEPRQPRRVSARERGRPLEAAP
jgi:hypothetical protein